jgi:hypothetical protein
MMYLVKLHEVRNMDDIGRSFRQSYFISEITERISITFGVRSLKLSVEFYFD